MGIPVVEKGTTMSKFIDIAKNAKFCLDFGFGSLVQAKTEIQYRNSIISVHNGVELLMKIYLMQKDRSLIYQKMDYTVILIDRTDTLKKITRPNTVNFGECMLRLSHFSALPGQYGVHLRKLNDLRNAYVHFQYYTNHKKVKILLIVHIFEYVAFLIKEMGLEIDLFLKAGIVTSLNRLKASIDSQTKSSFYEKVEIAKSHYFEELTLQERDQKQNTEDYNVRKIDKIVTCPACQQRALLKREILQQVEPDIDFAVIKRRLILKELACHHCGLNVTEYEELILEFGNEEASLRDQRIITYYADEDCPDCPDEDCPDEDCPDCPDGDCPDEDCPDCPDEDCPDEDCPDCPDGDCPDEDCPDCPDEDCPDEDCPDCPDGDCPDEDCPKHR